jgi:Fe-S cluster assembly protein SufD
MTPTLSNTGAKDVAAYWQKFEPLERASSQPAWLAPLRRQGMSRFAELGFPGVEEEDWRFTNVAPVVKLPFRPTLEAQPHELTLDALRRFPFVGIESSQLVFVDGHYAPDLSSILPQHRDARVGSLAHALNDHAAGLDRQLNRSSAASPNPFVALNTAFFSDGAYIHLPPSRHLAEPVHLLHITTSPETGASSHLRHLIVAEADSGLTLLESYVSLSSAAYLTNPVSEFVVGDNAVVEHLKFQDEGRSAFHLAALHMQLGRGCNFISHSFAAGAKLSRNNLHTVLAGEGVECILNGLYLTRDDQLADHHMIVEHAQPHCNSHEYFNGILDDRSRGVFHGRILVHPIAQKTDAKQTNKNLLLSDHATINTKPQLEIYADDVKCTHGATVGQLNDDSIFYLRARGIGLDTARRMLIHAFAGEIIERIRHEPARDELDALIWDRLEANPHVAEPPARLPQPPR